MSFTDFFSSMLTPWQWLILAAVPPAILALYFLKLRRQPLEVPSTYLWHRTIEDLHVNSLWQRLRQNLLLLLQLLLVLLVMLACLRPSWRGSQLVGNRFIFLVDNSASMNATDVEPTRLEAAKQRVDDLIEQMKPGDVAMLVSFSDGAQVQQPFTDNRRLLRSRLEAIRATDRTSDIDEALRVAAGLANPGRSGDAGAGDVAVAEAMPADLFLLTDGGFRGVPDFAMGNLRPNYVPMGEPNAANIAIVAFGVDRNPLRPEKMQAFARLQNFTEEDQSVDVVLYLHGTDADADTVDVPATGNASVEFTLKAFDQGVLRLEINNGDDLPTDNVAHAVVNTPQRGRVLFVSPENPAMELALRTDDALEIADISAAQPDFLESEEYRQQAASGAYDLVIFDRCVPETMPQGNTLTIGATPPVEGWTAGQQTVGPQIIDTDRAHPLMQLIDLGDVRWIVDGTPLESPGGATVLIDTDVGPLLIIAPREGHEDAVFGFALVGKDEQGDLAPHTDWVFRPSFPLFVKNVLTYLGRSRSVLGLDSVQVGQRVALRTSDPVESIRVESPTGQLTRIARGPQNTFVYGETGHLGVYSVLEGDSDEVTQRFAVNLFDSTESQIVPRSFIKTEYEEIEGQAAWRTTRREAWRWLVMIGLGVLLLEWYVYNRRVYL